MTLFKTDRDGIVNYLLDLRSRIISAFEEIEGGARFERKKWPHHSGKGGGEMAVLRGKVFEKAAVNWSGVEGDKFPGDDASGPFFATGVSLITHMSNPKAPTSHFNIRYIEAGDRRWLGGGFDLTPMGFPYDEDTREFHAAAKHALDPFGADLYEKFSKAAKEYFTIRHYGRERGVGGIFFDHYSTGDLERDLGMWRAVGEGFLPALIPILKRRVNEPFTEKDRQVQLHRRAEYVEFNLLYDRGTQFGFRSGGNPEAILCSMPPLAAW
ncbi:MAG TPA: oxygen-dependent coproporphyrinogen oxidase [Bdellovibrionota bacterium]|jgi:coproporphyrinogen III oxidase|nr:oxygen-dependent coproporphyrinogen oxidase [Bdellovibrionota bacterium]